MLQLTQPDLPWEQARADTPSGELPPRIARSWQQCVGRGQQPGRWALPPRRTAASSLPLLALTRVLEDLYEFLEGTQSALVVTDHTACIAALVGDAAALTRLEQLGLGRGSVWQDETIGTNAVALALRDGLPVATVGHEHFAEALHGLALAASPLFGPDGQTLGALAITGAADAFGPHLLATVAAAANGAHTQLQMESAVGEANRRLTQLDTAIEVISEGLLLISADDRIARVNQRIEHILGISARAAAGRKLVEVIDLPDKLRLAWQQRVALPEQELLFPAPNGPIGVVCSLKPITQQDRYVGALLTLHPPDRVRHLVHQVVGAEAQVSFRDIVGESAPLQTALGLARAAANSNASVLLVGEHGTGKELFARAIHQASARASGPFVTLNCAAVPRALIGTELFGFDSSAGDALRGRPGKLELAHGGSLLLKEIDALPMEHQTTLLHAIDSRSVMRSGSQRIVPLDVRVLATTTGGLRVDTGQFRADLAARLSARQIELPPLRTRGDDLLLFITHGLALLNQRLGKQLVLHPEALQAMTVYPWPGNIRELEAVLERIAHGTEHSVVQRGDLPDPIRHWVGWDGHASSHLARQTDHIERDAIVRAGRSAGGHLGRTAQQLGISRSTLWRKMQAHRLSRSDFWQPA